ncbi:MAG: ABC transporter ATP-binding protein [Myxococcota bacterium]
MVRAFAQEEAEVERFQAVNQRYYQSSIRLTFTRNLLGPVMALLGTGSALVALWYGAHRVLAGHITVGDLVEFHGRLALMAWPTLALGWILAVWQRGKASLERLNEIFVVAPTIASAGKPVAPPAREGAVGLRSVGVQRTAEKQAPRWTLQDVDITLPARGFLGVVGGTGSGKSTLAGLLPRLRDPTTGAVLVDDVDVRARALPSLRHDVALAPQEAFLFSTSILENLRFGRPDASEDEVKRVVELLSLEQDISQLPQGWSTVVGEKGITLSGGQRQRVALGRALLCEPRVLVLDDTVSAVDAETEEKILHALRAEAHRRTLVVISHRLSAVKDADEIVVLDAGRIVERGGHEELLRKGGRYAALWGRERVLRDLEKMDASQKEQVA